MILYVVFSINLIVVYQNDFLFQLMVNLDHGQAGLTAAIQQKTPLVYADSVTATTQNLSAVASPV